MVHKIIRSAGNGIPLGAEASLEHFKLIFLDVGISQALLGLDLAAWFLNRDKELVNRGTIAEAFVGQELLCYASPKWKQNLFFWKREILQALLQRWTIFMNMRGKSFPLRSKVDTDRRCAACISF